MRSSNSENLAAEHAAARAERRAAVARIRAAALEHLAQVRAEHVARTAAARAERARSVNDLQSDAAGRRAAVGAELLAQRAELQARLADFAAALAHDTRMLLAEFAAERAAATEASRAQVSQALDQLRHATATMLANLATARLALADEQRRDLAGYIAVLRDNTTGFIDTLEQTRSLFADDQRRRLSSYVADLRARTAQHLNDLTETRLQNAAVTATARHSELADRRRQVADQLSAFSLAVRANGLPPVPPRRAATSEPLPTQTGEPQRLNHAGVFAYAQLARVTIVRELEASRGAPGTDQRAALGAHLEGLANSVAGMLSDIVAAQPGFSAEERTQSAAQLDELRKNLSVLQNEIEAMAKLPGANAAYVTELGRTAARIVEAIKQAAADLTETPKSPPAAQPHPGPSYDIRDDLTAIRGIGSGTQHRLNQAGIFTFIQIALSSADDLRRVLGSSGSRLANVEDWIIQARALAGIA